MRLAKNDIAMLFERVFGVVEINIEWIVENGLGFLEGDSVLLYIVFGLIFIPLETHESRDPFSNPLPGEFGGDVALNRVARVGQPAAVFDAFGGGARALYRFVVEAARGVALDLAQLREALQAGPEADGAARDVVPADRVFEHAEPGAVGDEEQLHVEAEAVYERALY